MVQSMMNPQALNRYSYVWGNPLKYTDPTGLLSEEDLLRGGVSQEQIEKWRGDTRLWEDFISIVYPYEPWTGSSGGVATKYWFTYVTDKGIDLEGLSGDELLAACCEPKLRLMSEQRTILGTQREAMGVEAVGTTPGSLDFERGSSLLRPAEVHLVVGYGSAFVARGDVYALKYYSAAGLDAVATTGQVLGVWAQGCRGPCLGQTMTGAYAMTGNPAAPLAVFVAYQLGASSGLWVPAFRETAARWRR